MLPADVTQAQNAAWFGNGGSILIDGTTGGITVGSRHDATTLFGNDIKLTAGASDNQYAHVGFRAKNDLLMNEQTASGAIGVYAKNDVTLDANRFNAYALIGHGGGVPYSGSAFAGYNLNASNAAITVMARQGMSLNGGASTNAYAGIGHGGAAYSGSSPYSLSSTATVEVAADESALDVNIGGSLTLNGGTAIFDSRNAYARIGHGGAADSSSSTVEVAADESDLSVAVGYDMLLNGGRDADAYVGIGHGGAAYSFSSATSSTAAVEVAAKEPLYRWR